MWFLFHLFEHLLFLLIFFTFSKESWLALFFEKCTNSISWLFVYDRNNKNVMRSSWSFSVKKTCAFWVQCWMSKRSKLSDSATDLNLNVVSRSNLFFNVSLIYFTKRISVSYRRHMKKITYLDDLIWIIHIHRDVIDLMI